jgi:asparagine synthase (glutamine-hydrolysing)
MIAAVLAPGIACRDERMARFAEQAGPPAAQVVSGGAAVAQWGPPSLARLQGEMAVVGHLARPAGHPDLDVTRVGGDFAIAAPLAGRLLLARAALAGRPLYYWRDGSTGSVIACSRLAPLLGALDHVPSLNVERLASMAITWPHFDLSATAHAGIRRVGLGEAIDFGMDREPKSRTHALPLEPLIEASVEEVASELREKLLSAVRRSIEGARSVAVMAGGGVDSSGLLAAAVALARGATPREVRAITLDFGGPGDDRPYMKSLASALGIEPLRISPRVLGRYLRSTLVVDGSPAAWPTFAMDIGLATAARDKGAEVLLSGQFGDNLFDGEPQAIARLARQGHVLRALRSAVRMRLYWRTTAAERIFSFVVRPLGAAGVPWLARASHRFRNRAREDWLGPKVREFLAISGAANRQRYYEDVRLRARHPILAARYIADLVEGQGQISAATGIATASPFLDQELVSFMTRIPPLMLIDGGRLKGLYRRAMRGLVPEDVRLRPDKAEFACGYREIVDAAGGFSALEDLASMDRLGQLGIIEPRAYLRAYRKATSEAAQSSRWLDLLWAPLAVEAFARARERGELCAARRTQSHSPAAAVA